MKEDAELKRVTVSIEKADGGYIITHSFELSDDYRVHRAIAVTLEDALGKIAALIK